MKDFIYNQNKIPKARWRYGFRSSAATGCGWIATYNALLLMGYHPKPEKLIRYYERQLPLINGNFGTFILGPAVFFKQRGFSVKVTARRRKFDEAVQNSDVCILFYYWCKRFKLGAHFVAVRVEAGKCIGYNTFRNSTGPDDYGASLEGFLKKQRYHFPVVISVCNKK